MTPTAALVLGPDLLASMALDDQGFFGPPLGEALDGPMATARTELWRSADGVVRVGVWECAPGRFTTLFDGEGEFLRVLAGHVTCIAAGGSTARLQAGDSMTFPPGWRGEWRIEGPFRKLFAGWKGDQPEQSVSPAAGFSGEAARAMELEPLAPFVRLDGGDVGNCGWTSWKSGDGSIETGVWECDAGRFHASFAGYGEVFQVLNGELRCTPDDGSAPFTLQAGSTALFPRGWTGEWDVRSPLRKIYALWHAS